VFAFRGDADQSGETVVVTSGRDRARAQIEAGGRPLVISAPMRSQRTGHGRFLFETPTVRWKIWQSHEPATVRGSAELRVTNQDGVCVVTHARLHIDSSSHGG
jgi:hypothetical protein